MGPPSRIQPPPRIDRRRPGHVVGICSEQLAVELLGAPDLGGVQPKGVHVFLKRGNERGELPRVHAAAAGVADRRGERLHEGLDRQPQRQPQGQTRHGDHRQEDPEDRNQIVDHAAPFSL
jgi:hypothetical protein